MTKLKTGSSINLCRETQLKTNYETVDNEFIEAVSKVGHWKHS